MWLDKNVPGKNISSALSLLVWRESSLDVKIWKLPNSCTRIIGNSSLRPFSLDRNLIGNDYSALLQTNMIAFRQDRTSLQKHANLWRYLGVVFEIRSLEWLI